MTEDPTDNLWKHTNAKKHIRFQET